MTTQEALELIDLALSSVRATRQEHAKLMEALRVLRQATHEHAHAGKPSEAQLLTE